VSNICFPAGTPIQTDQGNILIEQIDTAKHQYTLAGQPILHITQTRTNDKYLIAFEAHSLGHNQPTHRTVMSKDHQVLFKGKLAPAFRYLELSKHVKRVAYSGEVLYNVLLSDYSIMRVNNLACETLHPDNAIAKLYTSNPYTEKPYCAK
jgi:hypothetical protein